MLLFKPAKPDRHFDPFVQTDSIKIKQETQNSLNRPAGLTTGEVSVGKIPANSNTVVASAEVHTQYYDAELTETLPNKGTHPIQIPDFIQQIQLPQSLDEQTPTKQSIFSQDTHKTELITPIKLDRLKHFLTGYSDKEFLVYGFQRGFHLGYTGPRSALKASNLKSCKDLPNIVHAKISKEVSLGRVKGPFPQQPFPVMKISPIGIVPKKAPGEYRLIHHLSYPKGKSVNDFIDKTFASVHYTTFDDAVDCLIRVGPGCFMSKTDIDSAFRLIPVHPNDHPLLGFQFQGLYYHDSCLPFGASSSCALFESFSKALEWIARHKLGIKDILHILDDFLIFGPPNSVKCNQFLDKFLGMCNDLGVPIKAEKTEKATTCLTFMGLELDSIAMEARLPRDKLEKIRTLLAQHTRKRKIKLKDLQSLLGLLNFCCKVVVPGRCFLRRLYDLTKSVSNPSHRITLTKESRKDLKAWQIFVDNFNGKLLLQEHRWVTSDSLHFYTDASGTFGYGAVFKTHWFYGPWQDHQLSNGITWKELFPIVLAIDTWGPLLQNKCITLHSDNYAVVYILNKQTTKNACVIHLVRRFVISCMKYNLLIKAVHVPGKFNQLPDALSRFQIAKFHSLAPWMDEKPTPVPNHLFI